MNSYNFIQYKKSKRSPNRITLGKTVIHLPTAAFIHLNKPKRVEIQYDIQHKAIRLTQAENTGSKVGTYGKAHYIFTRLSKVMPMGRYLFTKDNIYTLSTEA